MEVIVMVVLVIVASVFPRSTRDKRMNIAMPIINVVLLTSVPNYSTSVFPNLIWVTSVLVVRHAIVVIVTRIIALLDIVKLVMESIAMRIINAIQRNATRSTIIANFAFIKED